MLLSDNFLMCFPWLQLCKPPGAVAREGRMGTCRHSQDSTGKDAVQSLHRKPQHLSCTALLPRHKQACGKAGGGTRCVPSASFPGCSPTNLHSAYWQPLDNHHFLLGIKRLLTTTVWEKELGKRLRKSKKNPKASVGADIFHDYSIAECL